MYNEGDPADDIFFIKEGEFLFTQKHLVSAGYKTDIETLGALKKNKQENVIRKKQMKLVIKQKNEFFGYDEIYDHKPIREFSCICNSTEGEVLAINEKIISKKYMHQENLKYLEEHTNSFKA